MARVKLKRIETSICSIINIKLSTSIFGLLCFHQWNLMKFSNHVQYTAKNAQPVQGWWKQPCTMLCCPHCSMLSTILFSIVTPDCGLMQAQQCWTILLTTLNNVGSTTSRLFSSTLNMQVVRFYACTKYKCTKFRNKLNYISWGI